jgi:hypothetical protein
LFSKRSFAIIIDIMNTNINYDEQDTYDALRRVPRSHLEEIHPHATRLIIRNEWRRSQEDLDLEKELKRVQRMAKFSFIFGKPEVIVIRTGLERAYLATIYDPEFKGSGWTTEEYGSLIYKQAMDVLLHNQKVRGEKRRAITLAYLGVIFFSLMTNVLPVASTGVSIIIMHVAAPIAIGLLGGLIVSRIVREYNKREIDTFGPL